MHDFLDADADAANPILRGTERITSLDYLTDALGREASAFIDKHKASPWLCYLAFNAVHAPLQATEKYLGRFAHIADPKRRAYAALQSAMDDAVGVVLAKLREHSLERDTLVVFLSDNGGPTPSTTSGNGPLRGFKSQTWEGGIRVPFMLQWPSTIPAGQVEDRAVIQLDILPTALAAAGVAVKPEWKIDGVNLLPFLTGKDAGMPHATLYWRFGPQLALRKGEWKILKGPGAGVDPLKPREGKANSAGVHLYNLREDLGEKTNLADRHPEKLRELVADWERINGGMIDPLWFDGPAERGTADKSGQKKLPE
jgi:arylsulfatase A-like enzyme